MKQLLFPIIITLPLVYGQNQQYDVYKSNLHQYFEVTNMDQMIEIAIDGSVDMLLEGNAYGIRDELSEQVLKEFIADFKSLSIDKYLELTIPIYMKYLSNQDLINLINFYQSPTGKKITKHSVQMTEEMSKVMGAWGEQMGENFAKQLEQK